MCRINLVELIDLEVEWLVEEFIDVIIVDILGMLLLVCDVFECMLWLLVFVDGVFWVDVVVFLLCILNVVDVVLFK